MPNDNIKQKNRQVTKVASISRKDLSGQKLYLTREGSVYAEATYPIRYKSAGRGRVQSMHDIKQKQHLRRAMKRLRGMIRANFGQDSECEAHLTLTYKGVMSDTEKLAKDLKKFILYFKRAYKEHDFEYISIIEPHQHGGWHIHMLIKSSKPLWHTNGIDGLSYAVVRTIWRKSNGTGHGAVRHERLPDDVSDYGEYFVAYFTNAIPEAMELSGDRVAIKKEASKAGVKGSRLHFYPIGFKFYRASLGIIRPKPAREFFDDIQDEYGEPVHTVAYKILAEEADGEIRAEETDESKDLFVQLMRYKKKGADDA